MFKTDVKMEGLNQKLDLQELSTHNDKTIAQKLKQDLENLTWMIQRKEMKHDQDDDALLMVNPLKKIIQ